MKNKPSKKHHYLPRYYLRGFANSDDLFFVYDKQRDTIFRTSPDNAFFQKDLNTVTLPDGTTSDFLENLYAKHENRFWRYFDSIRGSTHKTPIELLDKMHLFHFIMFLYWRLPSNIAHAERLSGQAFLDNNDFDYFKLMTKNGEKAPTELANKIKNSSSFKKAFRQIIPFMPFFKERNLGMKIQNWRFLYTEDKKSWYIVGDNPIIVRKNKDNAPVHTLNEFVFPVSGNILVCNIDKPFKKDFPRDFIIQSNVAVIENSLRFVACQSQEFLVALVQDYKFTMSYEKTDTIIPELFEMLESE